MSDAMPDGMQHTGPDTAPDARSGVTALDLGRLDFEKGGGLVTVVAQDARSGAVLMVAHADRKALERTLATGEMHYRSRTRGLWHKGATSGNTQRVVALLADCDGDAVLARVIPAGPACHTGSDSCFGRASDTGDALAALDATIAERAATMATLAVPGTGVESVAPAGAPPQLHDGADRAPSHNHSGAPAPDSAPRAGRPSYTQRLLADRNLRLKKIGEEAAELILACADGDRERATEEVADLLYHALVALRATGGSLDDVRRILDERRAARR
ncbi:MAG: phosphoribosyl-ATP diphosphatase [Gemmatimonadaceae bacterium]